MMDRGSETGLEGTDHIQPEEHAAQPSLPIQRTTTLLPKTSLKNTSKILQGPPRWPQIPPRSPQDHPKTPRAPKSPPKSPQDDPKMPPRKPSMATPNNPACGAGQPKKPHKISVHAPAAPPPKAPGSLREVLKQAPSAFVTCVLAPCDDIAACQDASTGR